MSKMIFVNLPVADLPKSKAFYEAVGFTNNPQFTNDNAAAMMWSDSIVVMLLRHAFWKTFTSKAIPDARESAQVLLCVSMDNREAVDSIVADAAGAGGSPDPTPTQDHGSMYGRSFEEPDGHIWETMWMDPKVAAGEMPVEHIDA
jgi:predicted lactoylglutathione lyase